MQIPFYLSGIFSALTLILACCVIYGVAYGLKKANLPAPKIRKAIFLTTTVLLIWLGWQAVLAQMGFFLHFEAMPPRVGLAILPSFIIILMLSFSRSVRTILENIPQDWLIGIQSFRVLMEIILWRLFVEQIIPVQMTFEGSNFDVLTGLTALPAIYFFAKRNNRTGILAWNIFGLVLLITIVTIALLSAPTPLRVYTNGPANTVIGYFPFIWLPGFVVPFAFAMHVFSLRKLYLGINTRKSDELIAA